MTTLQPKALKVFLCHCYRDKPFVRELYRRLVKAGYDAWLDEEKLLPGQDWSLEIHKELRRTDAIIVILSNNSVSKEGYVQKEIRIALDIVEEKPEGSIFLIPLLLDECEIPHRLRTFHALDARSKGSGRRLFDALDARAVAIGKKQNFASATSSIFDRLPKVRPIAEKSPQDQKIKNKYEGSIQFLQLFGLRLVSGIAGFLASSTLWLICDDYYSPNDTALLSRIAEFIANSDFAFALLILIAVIGAVFVTHYLDISRFERIMMPIWLRYVLSVPIGYLAGAFANILGVLVAVIIIEVFLPLLILVIILGGIIIYYLNKN